MCLCDVLCMYDLVLFTGDSTACLMSQIGAATNLHNISAVCTFSSKNIRMMSTYKTLFLFRRVERPVSVYCYALWNILVSSV